MYLLRAQALGFPKLLTVRTFKLFGFKTPSLPKVSGHGAIAPSSCKATLVTHSRHVLVAGLNLPSINPSASCPLPSAFVQC